jgi:hypothetical protein
MTVFPIGRVLCATLAVLDLSIPRSRRLRADHIIE